MSSLLEKSQSITATITATSSIVSSPSSSSSSKPMMTKTFFFRSDSIRKIKCTAVYPFQVAGIKLSKNALIELLETNIKKARICTQKAMLNFYCMILKLLSTLFALWDEKIQKKSQARPSTTTSLDSEINDAKNPTLNEPSIQSYQSRLAEKLIRIQKHKSRLNGNSLIPSSLSAKTTPSTTPASTPSSSTSDLSRLSTSSSTDSLRSFGLQSKSNLFKSKFQEYCLVFCVHVGLVVMYLQVVILGIALNTTHIPSGLIFMLFTIGIIGYIFVKVSLMNQKSMTEKSPKSSPLPEAKNSRRDPIKDDFSPERQSRSKAKKVPLAIEFKYKTLSKVELL